MYFILDFRSLCIDHFEEKKKKNLKELRRNPGGLLNILFVFNLSPVFRDIELILNVSLHFHLIHIYDVQQKIQVYFPFKKILFWASFFICMDFSILVPFSYC